MQEAGFEGRGHPLHPGGGGDARWGVGFFAEQRQQQCDGSVSAERSGDDEEEGETGVML